MEEKLTKMVSFLQIVWLLAWTPYAMMHCWIMFFNASRLSPIVGMVPCFCCKISAATNAMLYGLRYLFFRIELPVCKKVYIVGISVQWILTNYIWFKAAKVQKRSQKDDTRIFTRMYQETMLAGRCMEVIHRWEYFSLERKCYGHRSLA